jgi:hypothetical protein
MSFLSSYATLDLRTEILFREYIRDYEFWAFGDIDLVYGDFTRFRAMLMQADDIFSCRKA